MHVTAVSNGWQSQHVRRLYIGKRCVWATDMFTNKETYTFRYFFTFTVKIMEGTQIIAIRNDLQPRYPNIFSTTLIIFLNTITFLECNSDNNDYFGKLNANDKINDID